VKESYSFLTRYWKKCLVAIIITGMIIFIQPLYWKYASGEWIVYSYGDQGFNFLHPALKRGLIGANIGWWLYTPLMFIAMPGWIGVYRQHKSIFWAAAITTLLAIYITLSWSHFESGGGLGQRNLIQIYPLMAFPLAALFHWFNQSGIGKWICIILIAANIYYSGWWINQAHKGGFFQVSQMNRKYILNVVGRIDPDRDLLKLLDTPEYFKNGPKSMTTVYQNDFELDTTFCSTPLPSGGKAACVKSDQQFYGPVSLPVPAACGQWIRLEADFNVQSREWDVWKYAQWIVQFHQGDKVIKSNFIRVHRLVTSDQVATPVFFDVKIPDQPYDRCTMMLWNAESQQTLLMDNLKVSCFVDQ
jgi:hypothetical protein